MPPIIDSAITSVRYYCGGTCTNNLRHAYRGYENCYRQFPAGAFLIHHRDRGEVLFDAGYAPVEQFTTPLQRLYRRLSHLQVSSDDTVAAQLRADGIEPDRISTIILSHMHPDHCGGVQFFPQAQIVMSQGTYQTWNQARWRDLVFHHQLPANFAQRLQVIASQELGQLNNPDQGADFFGDGSLRLVALPGHTRGHMGAYLPGKLLMAGDACWGDDLWEASLSMRRITDVIIDNPHDYRQTILQLTHLQAQGVRLCLSHAHYVQKELLHPEAGKGRADD